MQTTKIKRLTSWVLTLIMVLSLLPMAAMAEMVTELTDNGVTIWLENAVDDSVASFTATAISDLSTVQATYPTITKGYELTIEGSDEADVDYVALPAGDAAAWVYDDNFVNGGHVGRGDDSLPFREVYYLSDSELVSEPVGNKPSVGAEWTFNLSGETEWMSDSIQPGTGEYEDAVVVSVALVAVNGTAKTGDFASGDFRCTNDQFSVSASALRQIAEDNGLVSGDTITLEVTFGIPDGDQNVLTETMTITLMEGGFRVDFNKNDGTNTLVSSYYTDEDGYLNSLPSTPTRSGYVFDGWFSAATGGNEVTLVTVFTEDTIAYAHWTKDSPVVNNLSDNDDDGGSDRDDDDDDDRYDGGSSGGSGGSGGGSAPAPSTVTSSTATTAVTNAIQAAQQSGSENATARLTNPGEISLSVMQDMAQQAGDTTLKVNADSVVGNVVDVRISFDPSQATSDLDLSASTVNATAVSVENQFERFFTNDVMTVALGQSGSFGMPVQIAAKVADGLDTANLVFYAYDRASNTYNRIAAPAYWVDANGYVHFSTSVGGSIIISDGELRK